ncbi:hypothetical protein [Bacillus sp. Marseille-P3661]|uniref:hypothetical protein n=1 Tax=Bacillus sp. Marseille-P3661 TaxID=1936234 RepID=UPI000C85BF82|nr:hypothetical protein [Bacillus sp. Marseille-P3661]
MKLTWLILSLIPAPFLFHLYEYGQYLKREDTTFLLLGSLLFVATAGIISAQIKTRYVIAVNFVTFLLSLILAMLFIPNDSSWFKPFGRDAAVAMTAIVFLIGQLLLKTMAKAIFFRKQSL